MATHKIICCVEFGTALTDEDLSRSSDTLLRMRARLRIDDIGAKAMHDVRAKNWVGLRPAGAAPGSVTWLGWKYITTAGGTASFDTTSLAPGTLRHDRPACRCTETEFEKQKARRVSTQRASLNN